MYFQNFLNTIILDYSCIFFKEIQTPNLITAVIKFQNVNKVKMYSLKANSNNDTIPKIHLLQMWWLQPSYILLPKLWLSVSNKHILLYIILSKY